VVVESEPLGTAGGVINALPALGSGPLLVLYGDVVCGEDLAAMADLHERGGPAATLAVYRSDHAEAKGVVDLDGDRVTAFHEKDPSRPSGWVNAGIYVVDPDWLRGFGDGRGLDFGYDLFPAALASGLGILAHRLAAPVLDIGTPADLERARAAGLREPGDG
jgi:mannose-1-phosphate guanylyltransferase